MKIKYAALVGALAAGFALPAQAALVEGVDYTVMPQAVPQTHTDKIEVLEFFGYFCVHCYHLEPELLKHAKAWPKDTYLRAEHVVWQPEMMGLARVAAAVNSSGLKYQADPAVFKAVYEQKINLGQPDTFRKWVQSQTVFDGKKLLAAYDSFVNPAQAKSMADLTNRYSIDSTPTIIVGGKYRMKFGQGDWSQHMQKVEEMIAKVRKERGMPEAKPVAAAKSKAAAIAKAVR